MTEPKKYINRYRDKYWFEPIDGRPKHFKLCGNLQYWRFGGQEGEPTVDMNNLGFADPSGGPFLSAGEKFDCGTIKRIALEGEDIIVEVE